MAGGNSSSSGGGSSGSGSNREEQEQQRPRLVDVIVTHLSYDAPEQCRQVAHLRRFLDQDRTTAALHAPSLLPRRPQIVMGDFNIYQDFEWPMEFL